MEIHKAFLVILVVLLIVILFNLGIYSYSKRRSNQYKFFTRVYRRARDPWKEDKVKLDELSEKVASYKRKINRLKDDSYGDTPPS
jgi:hypothetical protein